MEKSKLKHEIRSRNLVSLRAQDGKKFEAFENKVPNLAVALGCSVKKS